MRFLADMGVSRRVVDWLRHQGHDAAHLRDEGLQRLADAQIFEKAVVEQRVLLTFDLDFGEIVASTQGQIVSVIVFRLRDTRPDRVIARLARVLSESKHALEIGALVVVEETRHRVRKLPFGA